jgi:hypothetical protein
MTDKELVERLLDFDKVTVGDARDAALRIKALTAKNEMLGREVNIARYGQPDFAWSVHVEVMTDLNAKLAKAVEALEVIRDRQYYRMGPGITAQVIARTTLAEIEGEKP